MHDVIVFMFDLACGRDDVYAFNLSCAAVCMCFHVLLSSSRCIRHSPQFLTVLSTIEN